MTSFANDIRPLFRDKDVQSMQSMFDLHDYEDVKENSEDILEAVVNGSMPCDLAWTAHQISLLRVWIGESFPE